MRGHLNHIEPGAQGTVRDADPAVSVVIPCRNEQGYLETCVRSMLAQEPPPGGFEVIVAEGQSTDGTRGILDRLAAEYPALRVLENAGQIVSTGLNAGIAAARGRIIVRADAHTAYASDYLRNCVTVLEESGADNVGGPWHAVGQTSVSRAIAAAFHSRFGSGGALAHNLTYEGPVDTVYLGCFHRELFDRLGGFDEELVRNQDDEFNLRIRRQGGTIWQSLRIRSSYHPRSSLPDLWRQYAQYGYWKVRVIQKHRIPASWRHLVPPLLVLSLVLAALVSWVAPALRLAALLWIGMYGAGLLVAAVVIVRSTSWTLLPLLPIVLSCFHLGYGYGFLHGVVDFLIRRRAPSDRMSSLSRRTSTPPASLR
jgi:glycosyltransferase involved in cell wall biosynthesis